MPGISGYDYGVELMSKNWGQEFRRLVDESKEDYLEAEADSGRKGNREINKGYFATTLKFCELGALMNGSGVQVQIGSGLLAG